MMRKIKNISWILAVVFLLVSTSCKRYRPGKDVIPRKKYEKVLIDIFLAESIYDEYKYTDKDKKYTSEELYLAVLEKYKITEENMIATTLFYSKQPKLYDELLNDVTNTLKSMNVDLTELTEQGKLKIKPDDKK